MKNAYEVRGDVTAIFINSPKYGKFEALISTVNIEKANDFPATWSAHLALSTNSFYIVGWLPLGKGKRKQVYLHRWIMEAPEDMVVDHMNHNTLDNTDNNLRIITKAQNQQNIKGARSASGIRGVYWDSKANKWKTGIQVKNKTKYCGSFDNIEEAEQAVIEARKKYMPYSNESA